MDEADALRKLLQRVMTWAESRCPQENDDPRSCPLCGATFEPSDNDTCKSAENIFPPFLLADIRNGLIIRRAVLAASAELSP